ncbi:hypothetical protein N9N67_00985 [Bacteriovoracaceae bacterium]|nr:hypothetical protein [Bacteriovoracaceae bacterium]
MKKLFFLIFFIFLFYLTKQDIPFLKEFFVAETLVSMGALLLVAYTFAEIGSNFGLPMVTGYILAGLMLGPELGKMLSSGVVEKLKMFNNLAIGIIALSAGLELKFSSLYRSINALWKTSIIKILAIYLIVTPALFLSFKFFGETEYSNTALFVMSMVISTLCYGTSPAIVLAIINESKAKGRLSNLILNTAVIKDLIVVVLLTIAATVGNFLLKPEANLKLSNIVANLSHEIGLSLVAGILIGLVIHVYLKFINFENFLFVIVILIASFDICRTFHLEYLLTLIAAGIYIVNYTKFEKELHHLLVKVSLPVFVIFFTNAGANIGVHDTLSILPIAIILYCARFLSMFVAGRYGLQWAREESKISKIGFLGYIPQAGVTLGLIELAAQKFPQFSNDIRVVGMGLVTLNLLTGPILLKLSLKKVGDIPEESDTSLETVEKDSSDEESQETLKINKTLPLSFIKIKLNQNLKVTNEHGLNRTLASEQLQKHIDDFYQKKASIYQEELIVPINQIIKNLEQEKYFFDFDHCSNEELNLTKQKITGKNISNTFSLLDQTINNKFNKVQRKLENLIEALPSSLPILINHDVINEFKRNSIWNRRINIHFILKSFFTSTKNAYTVHYPIQTIIKSETSSLIIRELDILQKIYYSYLHNSTIFQFSEIYFENLFQDIKIFDLQSKIQFSLDQIKISDRNSRSTLYNFFNRYGLSEHRKFNLKFSKKRNLLLKAKAKFFNNQNELRQTLQALSDCLINYNNHQNFNHLFNLFIKEKYFSKTNKLKDDTKKTLGPIFNDFDFLIESQDINESLKIKSKHLKGIIENLQSSLNHICYLNPYEIEQDFNSHIKLLEKEFIPTNKSIYLDSDQLFVESFRNFQNFNFNYEKYIHQIITFEIIPQLEEKVEGLSEIFEKTRIEINDVLGKFNIILEEVETPTELRSKNILDQNQLSEFIGKYKNSLSKILKELDQKVEENHHQLSTNTSQSIGQVYEKFHSYSVINLAKKRIYFLSDFVFNEMPNFFKSIKKMTLFFLKNLYQETIGELAPSEDFKERQHRNIFSKNLKKLSDTCEKIDQINLNNYPPYFLDCFTFDPIKSSKFMLANQDILESILEFEQSWMNKNESSVLFINGPSGSGKTSLLNMLQIDLKCENIKRIDDTFLQKRKGLPEAIQKLDQTNYFDQRRRVVLIDDLDQWIIHGSNIQYFKSQISNLFFGNKKTLWIFTLNQSSYDFLNKTFSLYLLANKIYTIQPLSYDVAFDIIKNRQTASGVQLEHRNKNISFEASKNNIFFKRSVSKVINNSHGNIRLLIYHWLTNLNPENDKVTLNRSIKSFKLESHLVSELPEKVFVTLSYLLKFGECNISELSRSTHLNQNEILQSVNYLYNLNVISFSNSKKNRIATRHVARSLLGSIILNPFENKWKIHNEFN